MKTKPSLADWLEKIAAMHPAEIELGLERVRQVWDRLGAELGSEKKIAKQTVVVAGTNGKGSTAFSLGKMLTAQGFNVGIYSSPHIARYNERIQIDGQALDDSAIVRGFEAVDQARGDIALTYFEFGTLAALACFSSRSLDVAILEVGLGGRLDAVNIIDADLAIITSVALDHTDWLGDTLEQIAREKAGVLRPAQTVLLGSGLPLNVEAIAQKLQCRYRVMGREFGVRGAQFYFNGEPAHTNTLLLERPESRLPENNLCLAIQACLILCHRLGIDLTCDSGQAQRMVDQLSGYTLPGRMEQVHRRPDIFVDVCHNPHGAQYLAELVRKMRKNYDAVHAIYSSLHDKDIEGVARALGNVVDHWSVAEMQTERAASLARIETDIGKHAKGMLSFTCLEEAMSASLRDDSQGTLILVFGSFYVVEAAKAFYGAMEINKEC